MDSEMREECPAYTEVKLPPSKKNRSSDAWCHIVVILGSFCFILFLVSRFFEFLVLQNCSGDKTPDVEDIQVKNISPPVIEDHLVLSPIREQTCKSCHGNWSCCGEKCYYFSQEEKTWHDSKKACEGLGASLVKIDSKEEQEHIQSQVGYISWVGLHKKGDMYPWTWLDGSRPSQKLTLRTMNQAKANCGSLRPTNIQDAVCDRSFNYICEKSFTCLAI